MLSDIISVNFIDENDWVNQVKRRHPPRGEHEHVREAPQRVELSQQRVDGTHRVRWLRASGLHMWWWW